MIRDNIYTVSLFVAICIVTLLWIGTDTPKDKLVTPKVECLCIVDIANKITCHSAGRLLSQPKGICLLMQGGKAP